MSSASLGMIKGSWVVGEMAQYDSDQLSCYQPQRQSEVEILRLPKDGQPLMRIWEMLENDERLH